MRRLIVTFAAAASITLAGASSGLFLATPAQAGGPPVGSCPDNFSLVSASIAPSADANGDGQLCFKFLTPTDQPFGPQFGLVIDNKVQGNG
jgi:hypothetical protein